MSGRLKKANSTACSAQFLESSIHCLEKSEQIISGELKAANGYHGLDHPAVAIDVPELECECKDSFSIEAMEKSMEASACRDGGEVYWILSVRGLVAGFVYEIRFEWFVLGTQNTRHWHNIFSSNTSSYTVRQPLSQIMAGAWWDAYISKQDPFEFEVTVLDMHPGLTNEDALIGAIRMNSAVNTALLKCAKSLQMASVAEEVLKPESVNKWKDMDERLNRNKKIALSTLTEVDIRFKWFTAIISGIEFQDMMEDSASTSGNSVANELNKDEYHLKEIQKILRDGDIVLDLGSNIGLTAILIAKMNPGVKVIGVEPSPVNWVAAQRNIRKMGVHDRVTVLPAALCNSTARTVKLFQDRGNAGQCTTHYGEVTRPDFKITKSWSGEGAQNENFGSHMYWISRASLSRKCMVSLRLSLLSLTVRAVSTS